MSTQLAIQTKSALPVAFAQALATPSSSELERLNWKYMKAAKSLVDTYTLFSQQDSQNSIHLLLQSSLGNASAGINCSLSSANLEKASQILQQRFWIRAIEMTDIMVHMPANRKVEWSNAIEAFDFPEFTLENLFNTLFTLLGERDKFISERVDGIFQSLSGDHVTNSPSGFNRRFIISDVHDGHTPSTKISNHINDLRMVIGAFMKRESHTKVNTHKIIDTLMTYRTGQWVELDGGAIRIRVYKKGTAHFEVHEDLSWKLNEILAIIYPRVIPPEFRKKNTKKAPVFHLSQELIGFDVAITFNKVKVVHVICERTDMTLGKKPLTFSFDGAYGMDKHFVKRCSDVMFALGAVEYEIGEFTFDYDPTDIFKEVALTGAIPDKISHQYYPTPGPIGDKMVAKLGGLPGDKLLEPQGGQGAIAEKLKGNVTIVEVSKLHCDILAKKKIGNVIHADFLQYAKEAILSDVTFDGIVMNPPYSQNRALLHLNAAFSLLRKTGTLVALVTQSLADKYLAKGFTKEVEHLLPHEFKGVSVDLAIITLKPNS